MKGYMKGPMKGMKGTKCNINEKKVMDKKLKLNHTLLFI
jgi:hypothetical protein